MIEDCLKNQKPIRLLKAQTGLPANIVNIQYYCTVEFGLLAYIEVQNDTKDELNEEHPEWIFFSENAEIFSTDIFKIQPKLSVDVLNIIKDYVKKSYADKNSILYKLFEQRKHEWVKITT